MRVAIIESHYLPSIEYFCALLQFDKIVLEHHEHFVKQTYRNRCYITTSQGKYMMVVPVVEKHGKVLMKDLRVEPGTKWRNNHWRTLQTAYQSAPFFEFYCDDLKEIIYGNDELLIDLNLNLLSFCLRSINSKLIISASISFEKEVDPAICDLRSVIDAKKSYLDRPLLHPMPYQQVFGNAFVGNLSLLDLLFCEGPNSIRLIKTLQPG